MRSVASAPASSANLGPGFDCIALALDLRCTVAVEPATSWELRTGGVGAAPDEAIFLRTAAEAAIGDGSPLLVEVDSDIPRSSGLGSSAAVAAATAAAALRAMGREPERRTLFGIVADLDGHPDNAAATVYGGLVAVAERRVLHLELHPSLSVVVAVPAAGLATNVARRALPETVPHEVAARSVARAIALAEGLRTSSPAALAAAAGDELHESHRSGLAPATADLMEAARAAGAVHAAWSGAGPSVIAFVTAEKRTSVAAALQAALAPGGRVLELDQSVSGVK